MSDHEPFAQVAHQKWVNMSKSLRSLTLNERMSESLVFLSKSLICSCFCKKQAICLENQWADSQPFPVVTCSVFLRRFRYFWHLFLIQYLLIWIMKDKNLDHENHTPVICSISHSFSLSCETISLETRLKMRKEKAVCDIPFAFPGGGWREN